MNKAPRYFVSVFGNPEPPEKDKIESGIYHPDSKYSPFPTEVGDILLFYCTGSYAEHAMQVPGVGIVLRVSDKEIHYRYLPFIKKIYKDELEKYLDSAGNEKLKNIRFSSHWLFEISKQSFVNCTENRPFAWP